MRIPWKPVLFVLANSVFAIVLALLIPLMLSEYGDDYELGWAYIVIIPACMFFVGIGIFLFVFGKFYSISLLNKLLPFLAVLPFFLGVKTATVPAISIVLAVLIILEIYTTVAVLIRNRGKATSEMTIEERQSPTSRGIASFIGWGALGFVLGGLAAILPVYILELLRRNGNSSVLEYFQLFVSYAVMGGIAGALLGRMALNSTRRAWRLAFAGGLGFGLGAILPYLIAKPTPMGEEVPGFVSGATTGAFGGAAMGQALGHWKKAVVLALGGMALFAVTHQILYNIFSDGPAYLVWWLWIEAAIAGVALGATMGCLEKRASQQSGCGRIGV